MSNMHGKQISENVEEYLETIYKKSLKNNMAKTTEISKDLKIAPSSVTQMLKKLEEDGYVTYYQYKGVELTDKGYKIAKEIVRKHRLIEMFLYETLKLDMEDIHDQACAMEHSLSDEAERKLCQLLEYPNQCPDDHNIIPICDLNIPSCYECSKVHSIDEIPKRIEKLTSLGNMQPNQKGRIKFIRGNNDRIKKLLDMGITLETEITLLQTAPLNQPLKVLIENKQIELEKDLSYDIFVEIE
ncbi:metal-dependent transcriptional regulator [Methanosphaera cuniculi]|uniref:DtxR family iron (Metal) dependent repressor n=1 Tax=Methanosphaera cuniculi TaxID=1077256 RepID=A0A2A2HFA0_9EURY|nr:metal-dependent transcriptional regulator [Methanosphaera cuniculi]PAV08151.1 DtxR family iron (metal) dependent repressor [Methanosphaera cuniculi]PWL07789.1 iron-dependent repressor IdeR [Methanosphaera cuniculi]